MDWYRWVYMRFGGRPWTYILRDSYHNHEALWIIVLLMVGATLGHYFGWGTILKVLVIFMVGYLFGHLLWGTEYIPNQGIKINEKK